MPVSVGAQHVAGDDHAGEKAAVLDQACSAPLPESRIPRGVSLARLRSPGPAKVPTGDLPRLGQARTSPTSSLFASIVDYLIV
jgi:hypothetical protein